MTVAAHVTRNTAETRLVEAAAVDCAYRRFGGPAGMPRVLLQHWRLPAEVAADVNTFRERGGS